MGELWALRPPLNPLPTPQCPGARPWPPAPPAPPPLVGVWLPAVLLQPVPWAPKRIRILLSGPAKHTLPLVPACPLPPGACMQPSLGGVRGPRRCRRAAVAASLPLHVGVLAGGSPWGSHLSRGSVGERSAPPWGSSFPDAQLSIAHGGGGGPVGLLTTCPPEAPQSAQGLR